MSLGSRGGSEKQRSQLQVIISPLAQRELRPSRRTNFESTIKTKNIGDQETSAKGSNPKQPTIKVTETKDKDLTEQRSHSPEPSTSGINNQTLAEDTNLASAISFEADSIVYNAAVAVHDCRPHLSSEMMSNLFLILMDVDQNHEREIKTLKDELRGQQKSHQKEQEDSSSLYDRQISDLKLKLRASQAELKKSQHDLENLRNEISELPPPQ